MSDHFMNHLRRNSVMPVLELKKVTPPDALIVSADMGDPTIFYYAERKGWPFPENDGIYNGTPDDSE